MTWLKRNWRGLLARAPLPTLALAASWGVGSFAALFVPPLIAVIQAAAFELTYIGLAIVDVPERDRRRRATKISLSAVAVSVVYNSAAGYFHRNPAALTGLSFAEELALAVAHGAPLAIVAYLVADLLFHTRTRAHLPSQRRALVRRLAQALRTAREEIAPLRVMLAQAQADAAQAVRDREAARAGGAQASADLAQQQAVNAQQGAEIARLEGELAQARQAQARADGEAARLARELELAQAGAALDVRGLARRMEAAGLSLREIGRVLDRPESTVRSWLKAATNGHVGAATE